jgi:arsenate reductase
VLFLCTGNSARSIFGEVIMNAMANGRFIAYSAGSHPASRVNPMTIELLHKTISEPAARQDRQAGAIAAPERYRKELKRVGQRYFCWYPTA